MSLQKLVQQKREEILHLATQHGAYNIKLFGSAARGEEREDSDIDFLVEMKPECSLLDRIGLMQDLEDILGRKVDVVNAKSLRDYFRERILSEAVPL